MRLRTGAAAAVLLMAMGLGGAPRAASYRVPDDLTLVLMSDLAVRGRVLDRESKRLAAGGIVTDVRVSVEAVLRGRVEGAVLTVRQLGGEVDGEMQVFPGTGELTPGERVILLLRKDPDGVPRVVHFALGKFDLGPEEGGREAAWRTDLDEDSALALGPEGAWRERLRDAAAFERWIEDVSAGQLRAPDYVREGWRPEPRAAAAFTMLKVNNAPVRREEFDGGGSVSYQDDSTEPVVSDCKVAGNQCCSNFHGATAAGVVQWNAIPGTKISITYGGTDGSIGSKCFNGGLDDEINYDDPCGEIDDLSSCSGTLAIGGFSATLGQTTKSCAEKGPTFGRILSAAIVTNNGLGNCVNCCNFQDVLAHETGHTIGFGHSTDGNALMAPFIVSGRCGEPQADDILGAQCVYPGEGACLRFVSSVLVNDENPANVKLKVFGSGFKKGDVVQIDNGGGFVTVPATVFKAKTKLAAKHVEGLFPSGDTVDVRVSGSCDSNAMQASR